MRLKITSKSFAQKFELKWSLGGPLSKLCVTPPFSISTLDVKLKTRWAITGSWEPLVTYTIYYFLPKSWSCLVRLYAIYDLYKKKIKIKISTYKNLKFRLKLLKSSRICYTNPWNLELSTFKNRNLEI